MKRKILCIMLVGLLMLGCTKNNKDNIISKVVDKLSNMSSYKLDGVLSISSNDDTYNYDVVVAFKKDDNYRVSIVNKANNHEQIILKSNDEVYVLTYKSLQHYFCLSNEDFAID